MEANEKRITIRELTKAYNEDANSGRVTAWNGKLDVRPEFQREFIYDAERQSDVINSVLNGFPLGIMYFIDRGDGTYEVLDGQQRIISICRYATNSALSIQRPIMYQSRAVFNFPSLSVEEQNKILDYKIQAYICSGTEQELMDWFQVINVAALELKKQEIRNAIYHCQWLNDAKSMFSRRNGVVERKYGKYLEGKCERQDFLETALRWYADKERIGLYKGADPVDLIMQKHRNDKDANDLWGYFESIFNWVQFTFGDYDQYMKGVDWGRLYNEHKDDVLRPLDIISEVRELMKIDEIGKKAGIYEYILTGNEKHLHTRQFKSDAAKIVYRRQEGKCAICGKFRELKDMQADHIIPWSKGGKTEISNCQMLCAECNIKKSNH